MARHIASASESEHRTIKEIARRFADDSPHLDVLLAGLLPEDEKLVEGALAAAEKLGGNLQLAPLTHARLDADQALRLVELIDQHWSHLGLLRPLLLNLARLQLPNTLALTIRLFDGARHAADVRKLSCEVLRAYDSAEALAALIDRMADKDVRATLDPFARQWPELALRLAAERLAAKPDKTLQDWARLLAQAEPLAFARARARASGTLAGVYEGLASKLRVEGPEATPDALPDWLREPVWQQRKRPQPPRFPALPAPAATAAWEWLPGERQRWQAGTTPDSARSHLYYELRKHKVGPDLQRAVLKQIGVVEAAIARALTGEPLAATELRPTYSLGAAELLQLPPACAANILKCASPSDWQEYGLKMEIVIAWLGEAATTAVELAATRSAARGLALALPLASTVIAPIAASALRTSKKAKPAAQRWLLRHALLAARTLLPLLADPKRSTDASHALRWLQANGRTEAVQEAANHFGPDGHSALSLLASFDLMQLAPLKVNKLPAWWVPAGWSRPLLPDGRALSLAHIDAIGEMLSFCTLDFRYEGIERLRTLCTTASLSAFAWDVFEAWLAGNAPAKDGWAFQALAHLGDDECARRLALKIRVWPGEAAHQRAVTGLEILAGIGTDVALMHLNGIAQKVKFKGLQDKARERIQQLAETRALSAEQLADRLVPDLGLDASGTQVLDFGPRQFTVGFDEALKPFVRDAAGKPLKELPNALKSDDAALASAATERWKALKKDARTLASQQLTRLELAMAQRRRWTPAEFRSFFVEHPLLRHLARRLLWGVYGAEDGAYKHALRVAEDLSYADRHDDLLTLPDDGVVIGLVHALELPADDAAAFGQILADYEILQPFPQLGRETFTLTPDEGQACELDRYKGKVVATGSVLGLDTRGWRRGAPQDAGWIGWMERPLDSEHLITLDLDPGTIAGDVSYEPRQTLGTLTVRRPDSWGEDGRHRWSTLDPIVVSEVLRDLARLAPVTA